MSNDEPNNPASEPKLFRLNLTLQDAIAMSASIALARSVVATLQTLHNLPDGSLLIIIDKDGKEDYRVGASLMTGAADKMELKGLSPDKGKEQMSENLRRMAEIGSRLTTWAIQNGVRSTHSMGETKA